MFNVTFLRWSLAAASAAGAVALGFFIIPAPAALKLVQYGGYYFILAAAAGFVVAAIREYRRHGGLAWIRSDWRLLAVGAFVALVWQFNEVHGFKILMDEMVLSATSTTMHFDRHVFVPMKAHEISGDYVVFGGILDKRPLFFPFLLSTLHDLIGHRPGNVFILNGALSVILLVVVGRLGRMLGGSEGAGLLAVLLLAGVPLVGLNATGAGFDLLNVVMICILILAGAHYLQMPAEESQDLLILSAVLLAQTRYESVLFVGATALLLLLVWVRQRRPHFSWGLAAAPVLLLTIPLQNKLFTVHPGYWVSGMSEEPFSPKFILGNLGHAVNFLFSIDGFQSGSPILSMVGIVCTLFTFLYLLRRWKQTADAPEQAAFLAAALAIATNSVLVLFYFWGQLDDFVATRLVLPLLLLFALSSAFVLGKWFQGRMRWFHSAAVVLVLWIWIAGIPFAAKSTATRGFLSYQEVRDQMQFVEAHPGRVVFVIPRPLPAIVQHRAAMSVEMLAERTAEMDYHLRIGTFDDVFVFQRLVFNPRSREFLPADDATLGPEFILETVKERQLQPLYKHRISRLVAVDLSRVQPRPAGWQAKFPPFQLPVPAGESPTGAYLREYLQNLP